MSDDGPARVTLRRRRNATVVFFLLYAVAVTWPGAVPFNRIRPLVLGLPFSLAWPAFWIVAGCAVLFLLNRAWERAEEEHEATRPGRDDPPSRGAAGSGPRGGHAEPA